MNRFLSAAAPRIQAPLAAVTQLVLIAVVVMQAVRIAEFSTGAVRFGAVVVGAGSLPIVRILFLRRAQRVPYAGALLLPPLLAAFVGPLLVAYMRAAAPHASFSFAGVSLASLGPDWPMIVAIVSAVFGLLGSAVLIPLVWLVARAVAADENGGARRFTVTAWSIALASGLLARFALEPNERTLANLELQVATIALLLQGLAMAVERRRSSLPAGGPYRGV
jgi:hypothetical protein